MHLAATCDRLVTYLPRTLLRSAGSRVESVGTRFAVLNTLGYFLPVPFGCSFQKTGHTSLTSWLIVAPPLSCWDDSHS
jgi:hypothetical protein